MSPMRRRPRAWGALAVAATLAIAVADAWTPLGFAHGTLYLAPLLLAVAIGRPGWIVGVTVAAVAATWTGLAFSAPRPDSVVPLVYVGNRVVSSLLLVATAVLGRRLTTTAGALESTNEARERERHLLDVATSTTRMGGWTVDVVHGRVTWSDVVASMFGTGRGGTVDLAAVFAAYHPDDRPAVEAAYAACVRYGRAYDLEARVRPAGADVSSWVRVSGRAVRDGDGRVVRVEGALQDVDERRRAAEAVAVAERRARAQEQALVATLERIEDAFLALDAAWRFTFVNAVAERVLQRGRDELLGRSVWDAFPGAVGTAFEEHYRGAVRDGRPRRFEAYFAPLDLWVEVRAHPVDDGLAVYFQDIGPRRAAEAQLRVLRNAVEHLDDAVVIADLGAPDAVGATRVVYANPAFERVTGRPREALVGRDPSVVREVLVDAEAAAAFLAALDAGTTAHATLLVRRRDGAHAWIDARVAPVVGEDGRARQSVAVLRDVTDQRAWQQQAERAQRMQSIGQLTGGLAHDFNNLLTVIGGNAELLVERLGDRPLEGRLAAMVLDAARRGADLTRSLLAFARRQPLAPRASDAASLLQALRPLLERTLGADVDLRLGVPDDVPRVYVDPHQLESALLNLVLNARDAMPDGGSLSVSLRAVTLDADAAARFEEVEPGRYVVVTVRDTGTGVAPDDLPRVFEPFFTTKPAGAGTGLGLAMVYGFAKQSRGHVTLRSRPGAGTTVRLFLPVAKEDAAEPSVPADPPVAPDPVFASRGETVLVVEDDAMVRALAVRFLGDLGYRVRAVEDGPSALRELDAHPETALVFTDVVMPGGLNGVQLADVARERHPGLRVLFTSGYAEDAVAERGRLGGRRALLSKPYTRVELARAVREALDRPP